MSSLLCVFPFVILGGKYKKMLINTVARKMVSLLCIRMWYLKYDFELQLKNTHLTRKLIHLCIRMCLFKIELSEKADPHTGQVNGFSPVCIRMCLFKLEFLENADPHT